MVIHLAVPVALIATAYSTATYAQSSDDAATGASTTKTDETDISNLIDGGSAKLALRYRYARITDSSLPDVADAATLRSAITLRSGRFYGFSAGAALANVTTAGTDRFNSTRNGRTSFPVEADPSATEIEEAFLQFDGIDGASISGGRRRTNWGNQRFISSVAWRQNWQTLDGGFVDYDWGDGLSARYGYIFNVNRIFSDDSPIGNFDSDSHIANLLYEGGVLGDVTAYYYSLDFDNASALSTRTIGANLTGSQHLGAGWHLDYVLEVAHQSDLGDNPFDVDEAYWRVEPSIRYGGTTLTAGYELLGGDGTRGFQTPLGLLHAYNGFADQFLVTPAAGLEDVYFRIAHKVGDESPFKGLSMQIAYHEFNADTGGQSFGQELDGAISFPIFHPDLKLLVKGAVFDGNRFFAPDVTRFWLQLSFSY